MAPKKSCTKNIRRKRKSTLDNDTGNKSKDDVTFKEQVLLHPREHLKRLSKLDDKVHFVKEVINAKPKQLTKTKKILIK